MELFSLVLAMLEFVLSVASFLRLEILLLPALLCELFGASDSSTGVVMSVAAIAWVLNIIKSITNVFKK